MAAFEPYRPVVQVNAQQFSRRKAAAGAFLAALWCTSAVPADALGVARIQQANGSTRIYRNVGIRLQGQTVWLRSADNQGTLEIATSACTFNAGIQRCLPYAVTLFQGGQTHPIAISHGVVFINLSGSVQRLPRSSQQVLPQSTVLLIVTQQGTYIAVEGRLDGVGP